MSLVGFRVWHGGRKEELRVRRSRNQGLVVGTIVVTRLIRGALLVSAVLGTLLAGGASLRVF